MPIDHDLPPPRHEEAIFAYVDAAFEDGDPEVITEALGNIARARSTTSIAKEAGVTREALYKALSDEGDPKTYDIPRVVSLAFSKSVPQGPYHD